MKARIARVSMVIGLLALIVSAGAWWFSPPLQLASSAIEFQAGFAGAGIEHEVLIFEFFETQRLIARSQSVSMAAADLVVQEGSSRTVEESSTKLALSAQIQSQLRVERVPGSRVLRFVFADEDAAYARIVTDSVVRAYLDRLKALRPPASAGAEVERALLEIQGVEQELKDFVKAQDGSLTDDYLKLLNEELSHYVAASANARVRAIELGAELAQLESAAAKGLLRAVRLERDPSFALLRNKIAELQMERTLSSARNEPAAKLALIDAQLAALAYETSERASNVMQEARTELSLVRDQQRQFDAEAARVRLLVSEFELHKLELARLQRRLDSQHKLFESQTGRSIATMRGAATWSAREVDRAIVSQRRLPGWGIIAAVLGVLLLGLGGAVGRGREPAGPRVATAVHGAEPLR